MTARNVTARPTVPAITAQDSAYARTATRLQIATAVWAMWDRLRKEEDLDQQWLADRMGKGKSRISRLLNGPGNWTLDTVADLLEAMGGRLTCVEAHTYVEIEHGDAWKARLTKPPQTRVFVRTEMYVMEDDGAREPAATISSVGRALTPLQGRLSFERSFTE